MTSLHADEAFLDHYQFSHDPFAARVPGFKFFPAQRKPVLGQLHHLARYSQLLLLVCGPLGSGKTLLRQALVASTNKQTVHSVVVSAQGAADTAGILRQVAQGLQVQQAESQAILAQVGQLALTGQDVYLLVDDAEQLSDAALASLLTLAAGNSEGRPHVFLFAEPGLIARLELLADGEECFHAIELQPYAEAETREYLTQRLEGAGRELELLTDEQIVAIHEQSGGWPGVINQVARDALVEAMLIQRGAAKRAGFVFSLPRKHLLALAVVGLGVLAAWLVQGRPEGGAPMPVTTQLPLGRVEQPVVDVPVPASGAVGAGAPAIEFEGGSQPVPLPLVGEAQPVMREPLARAAGLSGVEEADVVEVAGASAVGVLVDERPAPIASVAPVPVPVPVPAPAPAPAPVKPVAPVVQPAPVVAPAPKSPAPTAAPAKVAVDDWYAAQAGSRYTLQILGARAEGGAQSFVREFGGQYHYFKKQHQGQPLYVVTYGSFATREAAQAALKGLPGKVQAGKPWPRTFASIKHEIAQAR
ncbi:AAA family ATPase [Pseudomonas sp. sp1636]|uniref:SPOR domain-containing protein n=1 Tax=Pseudomonas sp. sp1636 TaxID=3036707 RepID=UPI0025A52D4A|nr:AAA family ATPase [Pseudomonas sp. sp1636]MDM8348390.1 AAA family ATPase [Pseudomonas sp. sp1636]